MDVYLHPGAQFLVDETLVSLQSKGQQQELELHYYDDTRQMVGKSEAMRRVFGRLPKLAIKDSPNLLTGETGTGKSSLARIVHEQSPRKDRPFVVVNCGALSPTLIESQLFGHEKGAFTGAEEPHRGF